MLLCRSGVYVYLVLCEILYNNCAKRIVYITNTNFNREPGDMPIYKTLEKSWILRIIDFSIIHFAILKETTCIFLDI